MAGKPFCFLTSFNNQDWIIDSGASDHITPHFELLHSVQPLKIPRLITMPNGKQSKITHIGSVKLTPTLTLCNVLHVPDFQFNLLSVSKLCRQIAGKVTFTSTECTLQGHMLQEVVLGNTRGGLYHVQHSDINNMEATHRSLAMQSGSQQVPSQPLIEQDISSSEIDSWHFRLGHLSFERMQHISLPCNKRKSIKVCSICPKAKLYRQSFPLSSTRAKVVFELIHVDIWGAYKCTTYDGYKYFLTIVDDYSRATWVHLMSSKSNAFPFL